MSTVKLKSGTDNVTVVKENKHTVWVRLEQRQFGNKSGTVFIDKPVIKRHKRKHSFVKEASVGQA